MKIKRIKKLIIDKDYQERKYYGKVGIYKVDCYSAHLEPVKLCKDVKTAVKELEKIYKNNDWTTDYIILKTFNRYLVREVIENEDKIPKKTFAVFSIKNLQSTDKKYYWGIIKGFDKKDALSKLSFNCYSPISKTVFLHQLKNGVLRRKNPFLGDVVIEIATLENKDVGTKIEGTTPKPLVEIIKNDTKNTVSSGRGNKGTRKEVLQKS